MYDHTITVFNFHEKTGNWYTTVFSGVSLYDNTSTNATPNSGKVNASSIEASIFVQASEGNAIIYEKPNTEISKEYIGPKAFAVLDNPEGFFTFKPETDFFMSGNHASSSPIGDEEHDEGLYSAMNDSHDGVYMITSAIFYGLLPHFEIGGR